MWTYIARRILLMIPTLFGITIIYFLIMQLAPGDPILSQISGTGTAGESSQTREAYLIMKRNLDLDKPILVSLRQFEDHKGTMRFAARYLSMSREEIEKDLLFLAGEDIGEEGRARRDFLESLGIRDFRERHRDPSRRSDLARAVAISVQILCEDIGTYGVPPLIDILESDAGLKLKLGAVRCLPHMVLDPHQYTYSRDASEGETPSVRATWKTWWNRAEKVTPPLSPQRREALKARISSIAREASYTKIRDEIGRLKRDGKPEDVRLFVETLFAETALEERIVAAAALNRCVGKPLRLDVPLDAPENEIREAAENWIAHYEPRKSDYHSGLLFKLWQIVGDTQYAHMAWRLVTFQFGTSATPSREPVAKRLWNAVLVSAPLMVLANL